MTADDRPATVSCPWCGSPVLMTGPGTYLCPESGSPRSLEYDRRMSRRVADLPQEAIR